MAVRNHPRLSLGSACPGDRGAGLRRRRGAGCRRPAGDGVGAQDVHRLGLQGNRPDPHPRPAHGPGQRRARGRAGRFAARAPGAHGRRRALARRLGGKVGALRRRDARDRRHPAGGRTAPERVRRDRRGIPEDLQNGGGRRHARAGGAGRAAGGGAGRVWRTARSSGSSGAGTSPAPEAVQTVSRARMGWTRRSGCLRTRCPSRSDPRGCPPASCRTGGCGRSGRSSSCCRRSKTPQTAARSRH